MVLGFREIGHFHVTHGHLKWPWIGLDPARESFGFPSDGGLTTAKVRDGALVLGTRFALPIGLPGQAPTDYGSTAFDPGMHAFAIAPSAHRVAVTGVFDGESVVSLVEASGDVRSAAVAELLSKGLGGQALAFDRSGEHLWLACEGEDRGVLALIDVATMRVLGSVELPEYPPPAVIELTLHPTEHAVLLLAACGQDGTFGRVARFDGSAIRPVETSLDTGMPPAGFVGISHEGQDVFLAEADALRTHRWPDLRVTATVPFPDDFISNYTGAVLGETVLVDGEDSDDGEDVVLAFGATNLERRPSPTAPIGMWSGQLATGELIVVSSKGEPARGQVLRPVP